MSLPGETKLANAEVLEGFGAQLVQLAIEAIKSGKKKVEFEIEVEAELTDDGKSIKIEVEIEGQEDKQKAKREVQYLVPL